MPKGSQDRDLKRPSLKRRPLTVAGLIGTLIAVVFVVRALIVPPWEACIHTLPPDITAPVRVPSGMGFLIGLSVLPEMLDSAYISRSGTRMPKGIRRQHAYYDVCG
jgi:hypothetical protein